MKDLRMNLSVKTGNKKFKMHRFRIVIFALAFLLIFFIYFFTSAPSLGLIDSGELTTVAHTLGIAHPTGYPLYTIISHLFSFLPCGDLARRLVIFSVLCSALACGILLLTATRMLGKHFQLSPIVSILLACAGIIAFAFSRTPWQTAAYAEVYPLSLLLTALLYLIGFRMLESVKADARLWIVYGFVFGLALGNHLSIVWTFPLGIIALWNNFGVSKATLRAFLTTLIAGILGATIILFLPVRSHLNPVLDWGNPETPALLWRHLTGWQYQVWMFQKGITSRLAGYFVDLPSDIGWEGIAFVVLGIFGLAKRSARILCALLLVWVLGVLYNINYDIPDIAPYFLPAHAALSLIAVSGAATLWQFVKSKRRFIQVVLAVLLAIPSLSNVVSHFNQANRSNDYFPISLTREVLRTLPPNALVLHSLWDVQSPVIYLQEVEGYRNDVVLIDVNLMRRRWYVEQLSRNHPEVIAGSEKECDRFLQEVIPFDEGKPFDANLIEQTFVSLHNSIISSNLEKRPVYLRFMRESGHPQIGARFQALPGAFFYRLGVKEGTQEELLDIKKIIGQRERFDEREKFLLAKVYEILRQRQRVEKAPERQKSLERQLQLLTPILREQRNP